MLHEFLFANRTAIIARTRIKVALRAAPRATEAELENGIPLFLDQLIAALRSPNGASHAIVESASNHGLDLLKRGFTVAQVVYDYGDVCQAVTELAVETQASISAEDFHAFNGCLDDAIAQAVTEYGRSREQSITAQGTERLGDLAHELRNALGAAMLSFHTLKTGSVGLGGSTAALLDRSLRRLSTLIDSTVTQVRLESSRVTSERVPVNQFIEEIEVVASMEANARGLALSVAPVPAGIEVMVDRELLMGAITNLIQNALKFTRKGGRVSIKTTAAKGRVRIDVEDECGGLGPGKAEELFRPFEQRSVDRTGLGLGLSISRRSVEAIGGNIGVRDIPGVGCVFTVELPQV
jgi:signal transduction histidine kinase